MNSNLSNLLSLTQQEVICIEKYNKPYVICMSYKQYEDMTRMTDEDYIILLERSLRDGVLDEDDCSEWLRGFMGDYSKDSHILGEIITNRISISKQSVRYLEDLDFKTFLNLLKRFFDEGTESKRLGNVDIFYKDISKRRIFFDKDGRVTRILYISNK